MTASKMKLKKLVVFGKMSFRDHVKLGCIQRERKSNESS